MAYELAGNAYMTTTGTALFYWLSLAREVHEIDFGLGVGWEGGQLYGEMRSRH